MSKALSRASGKNAVTRAIGAMTDDCRAVCDEIRNHLSTLSGNEIISYWQIGLRVNRVRSDPGTYGTAAVDQLATALQIEIGTLYNCARFNATFSSVGEVKTLLKRRTSIGGSIEYSHLVALSRVDEEGLRNKLIEGLFQHGWGVRDLLAQIQTKLGRRGNNPNGRKGGTTSPIRSPAAAVATLRRTLTALSEKTPQLVEQFDEYSDSTKLSTLADDDELARLTELLADLTLFRATLDKLTSAATLAHNNVESVLQQSEAEADPEVEGEGDGGGEVDAEAEAEAQADPEPEAEDDPEPARPVRLLKRLGGKKKKAVKRG